jgi:hypothetical protein
VQKQWHPLTLTRTYIRLPFALLAGGLARIATPRLGHRCGGVLIGHAFDLLTGLSLGARGLREMRLCGHCSAAGVVAGRGVVEAVVWVVVVMVMHRWAVQRAGWVVRRTDGPLWRRMHAQCVCVRGRAGGCPAVMVCAQGRRHGPCVRVQAGRCVVR